MNLAMDGLTGSGVYPLPAKRVSCGQGETWAGASPPPLAIPHRRSVRGGDKPWIVSFLFQARRHRRSPRTCQNPPRTVVGERGSTRVIRGAGELVWQLPAQYLETWRVIVDLMASRGHGDERRHRRDRFPPVQNPSKKANYRSGEFTPPTPCSLPSQQSQSFLSLAPARSRAGG